jgi:flagellar basal-body rod modification protein FlgD
LPPRGQPLPPRTATTRKPLGNHLDEPGTRPALRPVLEAIAAREATAAANAQPPVLGRDDFLKLLIAQLENQDPLQPAEDTEFVAQLATFSSLEQLITANDNLESLALGQANLVNSQALSLIGKHALVEAGDQMRIVNGQPEELVYVMPRQAQSATLTVYSEDGVPVRVFELETSPGGRISVDWDGTDAEGNPLPDGDYRIEVRATDTDGEPLAVGLFRSLPIDGVNFGSEGIALVSGDREIPFDLILEIRA